MKKATYFYGIWCQNGIPFLAPYSAKTEPVLAPYGVKVSETKKYIYFYKKHFC